MASDGIERPYTDEAAPYIEEYGGKIGGLEYLRDKSSELRDQIVPSAIIKPGEEFNGQLPESESGKYLVRGSHPLDIVRLVDVIPTYFPENQAIRKCIEQIREEARKEALMTYAKYEDDRYDGNVVIAVQPRLMQFIDGRLIRKRGSIVDHPDNPGNYLISEVSDDTTHSRSGMDIFPYISFDGDASANDGLIETHKAIAESGLISADWSFQVEFMERTLGSKRKPYICQVRAFRKKYKNSQSSRLDVMDGLVFGTTADEGVVLPVYHYGRDDFDHVPILAKTVEEFDDPDFIHSREAVRSDYKWSVLDDREPWALLKTCHYRRTPFSFMPRNLHTYLACNQMRSGRGSLEHNNFHLAQAAQVAIIEDDVHFSAFRTLLSKVPNIDQCLMMKTGWDVNHIIKDVRVRVIAASGRANISIEE